jgi:hypothetical protein
MNRNSPASGPSSRFDSPQKNGTLIPEKAPCYAYHAALGAADTTFVQFYPTLLPIARSRRMITRELHSFDVVAYAMTLTWR